MTVDVDFVAHGVSLKDAFREHAQQRAERLESLAEGLDELEVKVTKVSHHRHSENTMRVEVTARGAGRVVRTLADDDDKQAAFDRAFGRLTQRLRRLRDRRKDRRRQRPVSEITEPVPVVEPGMSLVEQVLAARREEQQQAGEPVPEAPSSPVTIRQKSFPVVAMSVAEAVDAMELVGHDFYLFRDERTGRDAVVYRRRGWEYGVISLDDEPAAS